MRAASLEGRFQFEFVSSCRAVFFSSTDVFFQPNKKKAARFCRRPLFVGDFWTFGRCQSDFYGVPSFVFVSRSSSISQKGNRPMQSWSTQCCPVSRKRLTRACFRGWVLIFDALLCATRYRVVVVGVARAPLILFYRFFFVRPSPRRLFVDLGPVPLAFYWRARLELSFSFSFGFIRPRSLLLFRLVRLESDFFCFAQRRQ